MTTEVEIKCSCGNIFNSKKDYYIHLENCEKEPKNLVEENKNGLV